MGKEIKITKKLLDGHKKRKREIPLLELELREMKEGDAGFGNSTIFDYRTGQARPQSVVGFNWELYEHRCKVVDRKKEQVRAVEKWINGIEDGQTRCVFKMFYIDGLTWERIADKTGYSKSPDYPRKLIRDPYLEKNGIK